MVFQVGIFELNIGAPAYFGLSLMAFGMLYFLFYCGKRTSNISDRNTLAASSILKGVLIRFLIVFPLIWGVLGSTYAPYPESLLDILFLSIIGSIAFLPPRLFLIGSKIIILSLK